MAVRGERILGGCIFDSWGVLSGRGFRCPFRTRDFGFTSSGVETPGFGPPSFQDPWVCGHEGLGLAGPVGAEAVVWFSSGGRFFS